MKSRKDLSVIVVGAGMSGVLHHLNFPDFLHAHWSQQPGG